ncbi:gamma-glutamylcyclotransferase family protein [Larkinella soli]|uniref:gamma-glutamylcyclotransferase family protein n=1 Tax=Larkinella soli TaxID=1770527 RepID=UPI000FFC242F|nr:gamma-glutamylcyclotransferase family protein [Larkinella soli]
MITSPTLSSLLFVYGTLLSASNHPMAATLRQLGERVGPGHFPGRLFHLGGYPGAVYEPEAATLVHGEIHRLTDPERSLPLLDDYEGDEYARALVPVRTEGGLVDCWTYLFIRPTAPFRLITSGRYFD